MIVIVNQIDDLFKFDKRNIWLMERGRPPVGLDGKPIELHHALQTDKAALIEVSKTMHQNWSKILHINPNSIPSGINREAFNLYRSNYWQFRLSQILKK